MILNYLTNGSFRFTKTPKITSKAIIPSLVSFQFYTFFNVLHRTSGVQMAFKNNKTYAFYTKAVPDGTFSVVDFRGIEGLSRVYQYNITLVSDNSEIDLKKMMQQPVALVFECNDQYRPVHGVLSQFYQLHKKNKSSFYRAVMVPRLWIADRYHESQLILNKTVPTIIKEILKQTGLTTDDYEIKTTRNYPDWEYICQYQETDLNFISRWMEREGFYYYFEQTDEKEKLIITDTKIRHTNLPDKHSFEYVPDSGQQNLDDVVKSILCRQKPLPQKVILRDYNYRKPGVELIEEATVDPNGNGEIYIYGDHFKISDEGKTLAKIRAEELKASEQTFHGENNCIFFSPGYYFTLQNHFRQNFNQEYLIIEVEHEGHQSGFNARDSNSRLNYINQFTAIPSDVQFRAERKTPKPRFYGTMNARIDASGDGKYAEIDEQGRYKVKLPVDLSGLSEGKASRWIRMVQPYSGIDHGMHFPLHKNTEVLLTFIDGDPDRPVISGAVPNPDMPSPVTSDNQTQSIIRTGSGNELQFEDTEGKENVYQYAKKDWTIKVENDKNQTIGNNESLQVENNRSKIVKNSETITIEGDRSETVQGSHTETIKKDTSISVSEGNYTHNINKGTAEYYTKGNVTQTIDSALSITVKDAIELLSNASHVKITASDKIQIVVGSSQITMDSSGNITIKGINLSFEGTNISSNASINNEINGTNVTSSATASHEISGMKVSSSSNTSNELSGLNVDLNGSMKVNIKGMLIGMNS